MATSCSRSSQTLYFFISCQVALVGQPMKSRLYSLLLPRLPALPGQCYLDGLGNLGNLGSDKEIQLQMGQATDATRTAKKEIELKFKHSWV